MDRQAQMLIVDGAEPIQLGLTRLLTIAGYNVDSAICAVSGLGKLRVGASQDWAIASKGLSDDKQNTLGR